MLEHTCFCTFRSAVCCVG